jgi:hypothetical protein
VRPLGLSEFRWRSVDVANRDVRLNGARCSYCLRAEATTRDHVIPRSRGGGGGDAYNLVPACAECNRIKGALLVFSWFRPMEQRSLAAVARRSKKARKRKRWKQNRKARSRAARRLPEDDLIDRYFGAAS